MNHIIAEYGRSVRRRQRRDPNYCPRATVRRQGYMGARSLRYAPLISPDERPQLTPAVLITRPGQPSLHHAEQVMFAVPSVPVAPPAAGTATSLPGRSSSDGDWYMGGEACEGTREECAVRGPGVRDGTRGPGHVFNTDGTTDESQPNIGKSLSAEQQAELGGAGSGTPGGWEPQDEENAQSNDARNATDSKNFNTEFTGREIANGHAFDKHVIQQKEFADLGIKTKEEFANHIENVVKNPTSTKELSRGRAAYWHQSTGTVVIRNPKSSDSGTAFRPINGRAYFDNLR